MVKPSTNFQNDLGWDASGLRYMMRLIERYGIEIIKKGKHQLRFTRIKTRND